MIDHTRCADWRCRRGGDDQPDRPAARLKEIARLCAAECGQHRRPGCGAASRPRMDPTLVDGAALDSAARQAAVPAL